METFHTVGPRNAKLRRPTSGLYSLRVLIPICEPKLLLGVKWRPTCQSIRTNIYSATSRVPIGGAYNYEVARADDDIAVEWSNELNITLRNRWRAKTERGK